MLVHDSLSRALNSFIRIFSAMLVVYVFLRPRLNRMLDVVVDSVLCGGVSAAAECWWSVIEREVDVSFKSW
jgi:hypothetical protein